MANLPHSSRINLLESDELCNVYEQIQPSPALLRSPKFNQGGASGVVWRPYLNDPGEWTSSYRVGEEHVTLSNNSLYNLPQNSHQTNVTSNTRAPKSPEQKIKVQQEPVYASDRPGTCFCCHWFVTIILYILVLSCVSFLLLHMFFPHFLSKFGIDTEVQKCLEKAKETNASLDGVIRNVEVLKKLWRWECNLRKTSPNYSKICSQYADFLKE